MDAALKQRIEQPVGEATFELRLHCAPGWSAAAMYMLNGGMEVREDDNKPAGGVYPTLSGHAVVIDWRGFRFHVRMVDLWTAVDRAMSDDDALRQKIRSVHPETRFPGEETV